MLKTIRESWGWTGLDPVQVVATNAFGALILRAGNGSYWRIRHEDLSCEMVAKSEREYESLWANAEFQVDWQMSRLVRIAEESLGVVASDCCYCLKVPAVLGGTYHRENFATVSRRELTALSGDVARQMKDLPEGSTVTFKIRQGCD